MSKYNNHSTGVDIPGSAMAEYEVAAAEKERGNFNKEMHDEARIDSDSNEVKTSFDSTHRQLRPRHIQLIGIGGTIGTALYVQIGRGLMNGGPASLFMAFTIWCTFILAVTNCMNELVTYLPISSPFIRFAGRYVDEAFGVAAGYNFFIFEAALVPFEIVACNVIIHYWSEAVPAGGIIAIILVAYGVINIFAVKWYGESEFWLALGKVLLIVGLIGFTFVTMVGGNPLGDRFGFRFWRDPGAFAELYHTGNLGRFLGFLQCLIQASFTIAGPDYVSMAAGECENPRKVMPKAFNGVFYRLTAFFVLGSLAVGILVPHNDAELKAAFQDGKPGAAASPYVVAMNRLQIRILPDIVNAMVLTAAFSAGNSVMAFTFIKWKKACDVQGFDRNTLPHKSFWQPFSAYYALTGCFIMTFVGGYTVFLPGYWDVPTFLFSYLMIGVFPVIFVSWKVLKKTKWLKPEEVNLRPSEVEEIEEYTRNYVERIPKTRWHGYVDRLFG
ncbi:putative General amino acid permease AGP2 [Glarea lozoyensis 74030]|uniref:Putative General amino acid permease AGP2 n=1 Tax=Glarea lozoyensis (strain ATCC 74030 / MF5533) TaxID=1104152 RepID=H0EEA2_GLAL7|nr:putative General amino acid permease AGP2 [Glarea lozoyensis 74030]